MNASPVRAVILSTAALLVSTSVFPQPSSAGPLPAQSSSSAAVPSDAADDPIDRALVISVDGLNPRAITKLGASRTPAFHRLMREGAWTLNARTPWGKTVTLPNHTSMLTSRRIDAGRGGHGVVNNRQEGRTVHRAAGRYVPSVYDVVHDRGGTTALYSGKVKFSLFQRTWNWNGRPDAVGANNGRAKIDTVRLIPNHGRLVGGLNAELRSKPKTFTLLHIALPDSVGHRRGFMSGPYLDAVKESDRLLGSVLNTIAGRPSLRDHTLVVLTADHGGNGTGHEDPSKLENYRIPFMVWGPGVPANRNLYDINPAYRSPGASRPGYQGKQPIRNADVGNLVTDVLDLPTVSGSEFNRSQTLNVF
jgi:hypothetical protein